MKVIVQSKESGQRKSTGRRNDVLTCPVWVLNSFRKTFKAVKALNNVGTTAN